jgi:hypothetical protein
VGFKLDFMSSFLISGPLKIHIVVAYWENLSICCTIFPSQVLTYMGVTPYSANSPLGAE